MSLELDDRIIHVLKKSKGFMKPHELLKSIFGFNYTPSDNTLFQRSGKRLERRGIIKRMEIKPEDLKEWKEHLNKSIHYWVINEKQYLYNLHYHLAFNEIVEVPLPEEQKKKIFDNAFGSLLRERPSKKLVKDVNKVLKKLKKQIKLS